MFPYLLTELEVKSLAGANQVVGLIRIDNLICRRRDRSCSCYGLVFLLSSGSREWTAAANGEDVIDNLIGEVSLLKVSFS